MKNGMDAPPAIAARLPTKMRTLSSESEYLNKEKKETGRISSGSGSSLEIKGSLIPI